MYICGLIPRNFAELAEAVPIEGTSSEYSNQPTRPHIVYQSFSFQPEETLDPWLLIKRTSKTAKMSRVI